MFRTASSRVAFSHLSCLRASQRVSALRTPSLTRSFTSSPLSSFPSPAPSSQRAAKQTYPKVLQDPKVKGLLALQFTGGATSKFSYVWLRDHCREERSFHLTTRQRLVDAWKIPSAIVPKGVKAEADGLHITWPASDFEDSYTSFLPWSFLVENAYDPPLVRKSDYKTAVARRVMWTKKISANLPTVAYDDVMGSEKGVYEWLKRIDVYGFALVSGIPHTTEATEELCRRIAFIRETHYGGFWEVEPAFEHGDLAYSDVRLEAHTDTTYFTDPCGLQLFHLLSPTSTHTGGENLLVDGFRAAHLLRTRSKDAYEILSTLPIPSHASGSGSSSHPSGVHYRPLSRYPVFNHDDRGELVQVRWNGDDRGPIGGLAFKGKNVDRWYHAIRKWENVLRSDEAQLWTKMEPGTAIIFDNHRVLHGRAAFTGKRRLCGAYINGDDYRSRLLGLEKQFGELKGEFKSGYRLERQGVWNAVERLGIERVPVEGKRADKGGAWEEYL